MYIGIALVACGWIVIGIGWYQAGRQDLETGQLPYLISGGFGGFGLLLMGMVAILADVVRQAVSTLLSSAELLHERMQELAESFVLEQAAPARATQAGAQSSANTRRRRPRRRPQQRRSGTATSE